MSAESNLGRVGPNAIIRVAEALEAKSGSEAVAQLLEEAGLAPYLDAMPTEMVDEGEVIALHTALRAQIGTPAARLVARDAGWRTGDYLLANRIPRPAQMLLSILPARLSSRALIKAIRANAWTFVGTGTFDADPDYPPRLIIRNSILCRDVSADEPLCDFYAGTYERLFRKLVNPDTVVIETDCHAMGAPACLFEVSW